MIWLLRYAVKQICGPKSEHSNAETYAAAFILNSLYGWIEEWIARGMRESAEEITELLRNTRLGGNM